MKQVLPIFIICAGICLVYADPGCPQGYSSFLNRTCYKVYNTPKAQVDAESQCESEGGYLASVPDGFTNSFLNQLGVTVGAPSFWLGIECAEPKLDSCRNEDESPFTNMSFNRFSPGNPSDIGTCVYMSTTAKASQYWFSFDCNQPFAFACEIDFDSECMSGYMKFHGSCYRVASAAGETQAEVDCEKDCGHLVSIHFDKENDYVTNLAIVNTSGNYDIARIGLNAQISSGTGALTYTWTDGSPLNYSQIGYNNTDLGLCYGISLMDRIVPKGSWTSVNCDTPMAYVCKTAPGFCQNTATTVTPPTCSGAQHYHGVGEIYSPGFPGAYPANSGNCQYYITSPVGTAVEVYFSVQSLEGDAYINLFNDISDAKPFAVIRADTPFNPNHSYKSTENQLTAIFHAPSSSQNGKWEMNYRPAVPTYPTFSLPTTTTTTTRAPPPATGAPPPRV